MRHVVFGTGQVGHPLVEQLVAGGHHVVAVNRDGRGTPREPRSSAAMRPTPTSPYASAPARTSSTSVSTR